MALPFTTVRHHSSSSVFLTDIIYSADFCYLVTAQERTGSVRQWYTRRRAPFPLACFPRAQRSLLSPLWYRHDTSQRLLRRLLDLCTGCAGGSKSETSTLLSTLQTAAFWTGLAMRCVLLLRRFPWNVNTEVSSPWFLLFKKSWCVRNPAYLPIESRERPQIAIIWLFDRCISLNSTYSKMIYYEIGSKRSLRFGKAKWQRRTNYITQATVWSRTRVTPCCQIIQKKSICQNFQYRTYLSSKSHKRFRPIFREYGACCSEFYLRYRR